MICFFRVLSRETVMQLTFCAWLALSYSALGTDGQSLQSIVFERGLAASSPCAILDAAQRSLKVGYVKKESVYQGAIRERDGGIASAESIVVYRNSRGSENRCWWVGYSPKGELLGMFFRDGNMYKVRSELSLFCTNLLGGTCDIVGRGFDACRTQRGLLGEPQLLGVSGVKGRLAYILDNQETLHFSQLRAFSRATFLLQGAIFGLYEPAPWEQVPESARLSRWVVENVSDVLKANSVFMVPPPMRSSDFCFGKVALYNFDSAGLMLLVTVQWDRLALFVIRHGDTRWTRIELPSALAAYVPVDSSVGGGFSLEQCSEVRIGWPCEGELKIMTIDTRTLKWTAVALKDDLIGVLADWYYVWGGVIGDYVCVVRSGSDVRNPDNLCLAYSCVSLRDLRTLTSEKGIGNWDGVLNAVRQDGNAGK